MKAVFSGSLGRSPFQVVESLMVERTATVQVVNPHGMHLRPADLFARTATRFQCKVSVTFEGQEVDGRSIVELLMLAARKGTQLTICTNGDDADEALAALVQLVKRGFDEMEEGKNEQ